ncbi:sensor histidine kinase [Ectobacillus panaciterrae]|uniref:sensor histidine kinase n=1 Tax=Ectobacillus panaciterrae TaxID=363872 RepID=UPI0004235760|nr:HAMP domain-containing sensor histidine kinase [Ectobacillus panaciterrae]
MTERKKGKLRRFFMFQSLRLQLLSRSLFILAGLLLLIGVFQYVLMKQFMYQNRAVSLQSQMFSIPDEVWERSIKTPETNSSARPLIFFPGVTIAFINTSGDGGFSVLSKEPHAGPVPKLTKQEYFDALQTDHRLNYKIIKDNRGMEQLIVLQPIEIQPSVSGVVQMSTDTKPLKDVLTRQMIIFLSLSTTALVVGLLTFLPVLRRTLIPLSNMVNKVEQINAGNLDDRLPPHQGQLEIDRLAVAFNGMLKRLEVSFEAEKEAKEQMRRFIADASHELRTPLTSIHGFLEVLLRGAATNPDQLHKALKSMYGESERLNKLVQDLILLAKLDRIPTVQMEEGFLDVVIYEMESQLRLLAGERKVIFSIMPNVKATFDQDKIKQVILNLYHNAVQHTDSKTGIIRVSLEWDSQGILLAVQDNGPGIPKEHVSHLFDRFYRIESSRSRKYGGAGLGLAITKSLIDIHGGTIQVKSKEGEGSIFQIWLPA